jgi:soluble lytic murein transglycosylase
MKKWWKYPFCILLIGILPVLISPVPAKSDIYVYVDEEGVWHFTNAPTSARYKPFIRDRWSKGTTRKYDDLINEASRKYGLSFHLLKAVIKVESDFNPRAVSRSGALGLMQVMPFNLQRFNISDPFNPRQNILGGAYYLKKLLKRYNGRVAYALAGYNAGPLMVDKHNGIPPITETRRYVKKVLKYYRIYKKM